MKTLLLSLLLLIACSVSKAARLPNHVKCMDAEKEEWCAPRKEKGLCTHDTITMDLCQKNCGLCHKCYDADKDKAKCKLMKELTNCSLEFRWTYSFYARANCQKTCGICFKCFDAQDEGVCKLWQKKGWCKTDAYTRGFCKKTCGYCR